MEKWEIDLRETIENLQTNSNNPVKKKSPPKKENNTFLMVILFIIFFVFILFLYDWKNGDKIQNWLFSNSQENMTQPIQEYFPREPREPREPKKDEIIGLKSDIQNMNEKLKHDTDRINLIGVLLNENFNIISNGGNCGNFVFFNRDWTINKVPSHITLSEQDKEYLRKFVK